jgi:hypothetical protein
VRSAHAVVMMLVVCLAASVKAQEENDEISGVSESAGRGEQGGQTFSINGSLKLQSGMFVPLTSTLFKEYKNEAFEHANTTPPIRMSTPCDIITTPHKPCYPTDHGQKAGTLSMFRATLQLEGDWKPNQWIAVHSIIRGTRSLMTDADGYAQIPVTPTGSRQERINTAKQYVLDHFYNTIDLREFYVDAFLTDWLSFRIGRQQVTWGETGQFRLLDVINPIDGSWHFAPIESFKDTRIPLWIVKALVEFPSIEHDLEIVWVPGLDRPQDMVTVVGSLYGAWGAPYSNSPGPYNIDERVFLYPKNDIKDTMRIGFRWKGSITRQFSYSLVYYYTHQLSPPIPLYYDLIRNDQGVIDPEHMKAVYLGFPRQHIAGFSFDYTPEYPVGGVFRVEASIEPDRTIPRQSTTSQKTEAPDGIRFYYHNPKKLTVSYAVVYTRPTMIRFLNPAQNITFNLQWMHTIVPSLDSYDKIDLVEVPGLNDWKIKQHSMLISFAMFTSYMNGFLNPMVIVAYILPDSGFVSAQLGFRFGDYWRVNLAVLDIFGAKPYEGLGLLRDHSEINLSVLCQF